MSSRFNPFARRETHDPAAVVTYKVLTFVTWLVLVITAFYYSFHDDHYPHRTIWDQNSFYWTAFSLNSVIASIYWLVLFILQIGYIWHLFSSNVDYVNAAASVGSHFIFHNLLTFGFILLFVHNWFWIAEIILVINFFNLSSLYFRHPLTPRAIHIASVSGPLAWTFLALYWNGAIMVNAHTLVARIIANIAVWSILAYGLFFLVTFKDYTIGFELSILTASLGVGQFFRQIVALQWIFAFAIMAALFLASLVVGIPGILGREITFGRNTVVTEDQERAPLLDDA
jgi:hypothetical protein